MKHIVLYSHGFGVRKDDRGQFPDIAAAMPDLEHVMFEYNDYDESTKIMTASPLDQQAKKLKAKYEQLKAKNPEAIIDLVCHSQGCVVASMAGVQPRKTIFLAPPRDVSVERMQRFFGDRPGATLNPDGDSLVPRRDGTTTKIPATYWKSAVGPDLIELYSGMAKQTSLYIIIAKDDEVLGKGDFTGVEANIQTLSGDHNFGGGDRAGMVGVVKGIIEEK